MSYDVGQGAGGGSDEDRSARLNRELIELLNELRVVLPGVQVLFAFLLTVPFSERFNQTTDEQRGVYFLCFVATALASVTLLAITSQHRLRWRAGAKEELLQRANRLAIVGMLFLAVAIGSAVFLVTDFVYQNVAAGAATGVIVATILWLWFGQPLVQRGRGADRRG